MKKELLLLLLISCSLFAKAQQDSILVVIECDSLYRPFLEYAGVAIVSDRNQESKFVEYSFKIDTTTRFKIPIPRSNSDRYSITIRTSVGLWDFFTGEGISYGLKDYKIARYDLQTGGLIRSKIHTYGVNKVIKIQLPSESESNKYLIDNTCPICSKNDRVSWIVHGTLVEDPITNEIAFNPKPFNPYNNPISPVFYNGSCSLDGKHWHCNRCKKEY